MSRDNVFKFFSHVVKDKDLKSKISATSTPTELTQIGHQAGYSFSVAHFKEALKHLSENPGLFGNLAETILELFSPIQDNYPATGIQPFSGDPNPYH